MWFNDTQNLFFFFIACVCVEGGREVYVCFSSALDISPILVLNLYALFILRTTQCTSTAHEAENVSASPTFWKCISGFMERSTGKFRWDLTVRCQNDHVEKLPEGWRDRRGMTVSWAAGLVLKCPGDARVAKRSLFSETWYFVRKRFLRSPHMVFQ